MSVYSARDYCLRMHSRCKMVCRETARKSGRWIGSGRPCRSYTSGSWAHCRPPPHATISTANSTTSSSASSHPTASREQHTGQRHKSAYGRSTRCSRTTDLESATPADRVNAQPTAAAKRATYGPQVAAACQSTRPIHSEVYDGKESHSAAAK